MNHKDCFRRQSIKPSKQRFFHVDVAGQDLKIMVYIPGNVAVPSSFSNPLVVTGFFLLNKYLYPGFCQESQSLLWTRRFSYPNPRPPSWIKLKTSLHTPRTVSRIIPQARALPRHILPWSAILEDCILPVNASAIFKKWLVGK